MRCLSMNLTQEQNTIVNADDDLILVKAGAGTGKTEVLARRIIHLLETYPDCSITNIGVITFTNKATDNLKIRIKKYLQQKWESSTGAERQRYRFELESVNTAQISTIHKFCQSILNIVGPIHHPRFTYSPNYTVSSGKLDQSINKIIEMVIKDYEDKGETIYHYKFLPTYELKNILKQIYIQTKSKGLDLDELIKIKPYFQEEHRTKRRLRKELYMFLENIEQKYSELKRRTLDTDDLLGYTYHLLNDSSQITELIKSKYHYLFIDEFQDTSRYQTGIIKKICDGTIGSPKLFLVGDAKQSIYKFRGADQRSYGEVERWVNAHGKVLPLNTNFRSTHNLVALVNYVFKQINESHPYIAFKPEPLLVAPHKKNPNFSIDEAYEWVWINPEETTYEDEVTNKIRALHQNGIEFGKIAVLFRKNRPMINYAQKLAEAGIPYRLVGAGDFYTKAEIIATYRVLNYLQHRMPLQRLEALESIFFKKSESLLNLFLETYDAQSALQEFTPAQTLDLLFTIVKIHTQVNRIQHANLNKLKEIVRRLNKDENMSLYKVVNWLSIQIATNRTEPQADLGQALSNKNEIELITIHKAKGLEYPYVLLPELDQPYTNYVTKPTILVDEHEGIEFRYQKYRQMGELVSEKYNDLATLYQKDLYAEELRVLYVALTRAEEKLILFGNRNPETGKECMQNWLECIID